MSRAPGRSRLRRLLARLRSLARGLFRRADVEAEMNEEFRHHIEMRTADLERDGLPRAEAARRAHLEFGHVETHRDRARAALGLGLVDQLRFSWIDVKLGLRMLVKHPGLTGVAVLALGVGIPVGLAPMHLSSALEAPLPEDPDDRVRALRYWNPVTSSVATPTRADYRRWSEGLGSFATLGAFRNASYNLASGDGTAAPVAGAEVTASTFRILGRPPLFGRPLLPGDEAPGAAAVVVIGHDLWRSRFAGAPDIVGGTVRIGRLPHTVVGVMPAGFLFPLNQQMWLPLPSGVAAERAGSEVMRVFGRLAAGVSAEAAQAELGALEAGEDATTPANRSRLQPEVVPFAMSFVGLPRSGLEAEQGFVFFQALAVVLLLVACGNVAMLVFARTATRFRELAVRTALGASRLRIVSQVFVETLVLAVLAAGIGIFVVDRILGHVNLAALIGEASVPYWFRLGVTPAAVVQALVLAVGSATVAGVLPALRVTGRKIQESIRRSEPGRSGIRFGGVTCVLVVADIAVSVAVAGFALALSDRMMDTRASEELAGIPAEEFLSVELRMPARIPGDGGDVEIPRFTERLAATQEAIVERLEAEPGVRAVAVANVLPRMDHPSRTVEIEGSADGPTWVRFALVDVECFKALSQPMLAGRSFDRADLEAAEPPVIVNTVFAERFLGGGDALGRRLRFVARDGSEAQSWRNVVGVVGHLGTNMVNPAGGPGLYVPAAPGEIHPLRLGIHTGGTPESMVPRVRQLVSEVDPEAMLSSAVTLGEVHQGDWYLAIGVAAGLAFLVGVLIVLATSGLYAIMSFSVSERTREIGIRIALGAPRGRVVSTVLRRSLVQIAVGALLGAPLAARVFFELRRDAGLEGGGLLALLTGAGLAVGIVAVVGLFSCLVPARRVLGVEASRALRAEG